MASNERQRKAYCDVCWFLDGWHGMILQTCKTCNVSVHNECYGREGKKVKKRDPGFECWACAAVGTTIKVRERDDDDNHVEYKIEARPTECMLCSVDDGYDWMHAMHPIYDDWGLKGRQKVLPAVKKKPKRLGWGHTLCCMTISSRFTFIYGCLQNGSYSGGNARFNLKDDDSINSLLYCADAQSSDGDHDAIHHFVYGPTAPNREINEFKHLKCILCGKNDELATSFRIPSQCCANDPTEFTEFQGCHKDLRDDTCYSAFHVGCAMWHKDDAGEYPSKRRMFYFPNSFSIYDESSEVRTSLFCQRHAEDLPRLSDGNGNVWSAVRYPTGQSIRRRPVPPPSPRRDNNTGNTVRCKKVDALSLREQERGQHSLHRVRPKLMASSPWEEDRSYRSLDHGRCTVHADFASQLQQIDNSDNGVDASDSIHQLVRRPKLTTSSRENGRVNVSFNDDPCVPQADVASLSEQVGCSDDGANASDNIRQRVKCQKLVASSRERANSNLNGDQCAAQAAVASLSQQVGCSNNAANANDSIRPKHPRNINGQSLIALDAEKEKQRQEVIRKIHKDLHEKLLHFDKDPTIYLRSDYIHCVTSLSVYWKERIDTDEETFTDWFNAALQRTRNTLKKSHEMIPDIVMPKASSEKNCQKKRCPETSETPHVLKRKYVECNTYVDEASHEELLAATPNSQVGQNSAGETDQQCDEVYLSSDSSCSYLGFEDMRMQYCKNLVVKILAKEKLISLQVKTQRRDDIVDKECNPERNDLETSSKFHVDDILSEMKTKCKAKLRKKFTKEQVDELWMDVVKRVYSALDYSATPTDWSFLTRSGHDNPECMLSWKQWDTYNGLIPTSVEVDGFAMAMRSEDDEDTARDI